uniref:Uncharacterized protein n=1 Tax=Oryza barthii TaxID=65489 RepID=A0A0D3F8H9_9ORYZ
MSTGLELGSGSGRAGGLPVGDRRSRRRRRYQELRLPAARRRAQEEARLEGGHSGVRSGGGWVVRPYVFSEAYIAYRYVLKTFLCLHSQSHLHGCRQRVGIWMRSNHVYCAISVRQECMLDYKVSTNYT